MALPPGRHTGTGWRQDTRPPSFPFQKRTVCTSFHSQSPVGCLSRSSDLLVPRRKPHEGGQIAVSQCRWNRNSGQGVLHPLPHDRGLGLFLGLLSIGSIVPGQKRQHFSNSDGAFDSASSLCSCLVVSRVMASNQLLISPRKVPGTWVWLARVSFATKLLLTQSSLKSTGCTCAKQMSSESGKWGLLVLSRVERQLDAVKPVDRQSGKSGYPYEALVVHPRASRVVAKSDMHVSFPVDSLPCPVPRLPIWGLFFKVGRLVQRSTAEDVDATKRQRRSRLSKPAACGLLMRGRRRNRHRERRSKAESNSPQDLQSTHICRDLQVVEQSPGKVHVVNQSNPRVQA